MGRSPAEVLQRLIRFDTTNPPGREAGAIGYVDELLRGAGLRTTILARDPSRPNLVTRLSGRGTAPPLLVPESLTGEVAERVSASGEILLPLDEMALRTTIRELAQENPQSVAVCLLFSFLKPEHEERCRAMGITDVKKIYRAKDLAPGERVIFAATGVTDGTLMRGVRFFGDGTRTSSVIMQNDPHRIRFIDSIHVNSTGDVRIRF